MYAAYLLLIAVSLTLQVVAACLALRLVRVTGASAAWLAIAAGISAMAIRRATALFFGIFIPSTVDLPDIWGEGIGLLISVLLLAGISAIGPLFRTIQQARESIEQSNDRLLKEVARQTSELVAANEQLKQEVAHRAKAEAALREEQQRLSAVLEIYEQDRRLVAYEIHDGFAQTAAAASMALQAGMAVFAHDPNKSLNHVVTAQQQVQRSLSQARSLIRGLRPVVLDELGPVAAIEQLVHDIQSESEVHVDWSPDVAFTRLSPALELSIFRIVQEAVTNAVRHGKSERVAIELKQMNRAIHLRIEDWGCGFDPSASKANHYGLEGIRQRARLFGGAACIDSAPGKGTRIEVELPLIERD